jgi:hypothetical protein
MFLKLSNVLNFFFCERHCDGFVQSIQLWSQKTPLLGKDVPTNAQPTTERHPLLGKGHVLCLYNLYK